MPLEDRAASMAEVEIQRKWALNISENIVLDDTGYFQALRSILLEKEGTELFLFERHLFEKTMLSPSKMLACLVRS